MPAPPVGVYVTEQLALFAVGLPRVQVVLVKDPVPLELSVTVPDGADGAPELVSVTVAVHVLPWFKATGFGEQLTTVEVVRKATTMVPVPVLVACTAEPL